VVESQGEVTHSKNRKSGSPEAPEAAKMIQRLDALIRIALEGLYKNKKVKNEGDATRMLKSVGLGPTEIARVLGKKKASDVAQYLY